MKNPSFMGYDRQSPRALDRTLDVFPRDFCLFKRHDPLAVLRGDVATGNAGIDGIDLDRRHQFGFLDRLLDRFHGTLDIDHDAFAEPSRRAGSDPDDVERPLIGDFRNYGADLRGPDVQPHKNLITLRHSPHTLSRTMTRLS